MTVFFAQKEKQGTLYCPLLLALLITYVIVKCLIPKNKILLVAVIDTHQLVHDKS